MAEGKPMSIRGVIGTIAFASILGVLMHIGRACTLPTTRGALAKAIWVLMVGREHRHTIRWRRRSPGGCG